MTVEVNELYSNLNKLLDDICQFLTDKSNYEKLSPYARKQADELINRSKHQLQEISKINIDNEYDGAYVDMERKPGEIIEDDKNNIYSSVEEPSVVAPLPVPQLQPNPYANLPAKDLSRDIKYGALSWKCRIILKFEKVRRIYAGVHDNWLLVYSSEKDSKPLQTFDLRIHKTQVVVPKCKNLPQDFELVCTVGERKSYYFLALTHKDMLQWTSHINRCYENRNKSEKSSISEESSERYGTIPEVITQENLEEDEEEIYHELDSYIVERKEIVTKPPDLPARRFLSRNFPLPPAPKIEEDEDSNEYSPTYDPVQSSRESFESNGSFSEDDEDGIYEQFVSKSPEVAPQVNVLVKPPEIKLPPKILSNSNKKEENNIAKNFEKPKTPAKPQVPKDKPKNIAIMKK